jgi:hypothetical protein
MRPNVVLPLFFRILPCLFLSLVLGAIMVGAPAQATTETMLALLQQAEASARPRVPLRADGDLVVTVPGSPPARHQAILIQRENGDLYIELRDPSVKAVILDRGARSYVLPANTSKPRPFALDEQLLGSDFTCEDLQPFLESRYLSPQVVDSTPHQVTVSLVPRKSQYSLLVMTFEAEKKINTKTLYYTQTLNNLVKIRRVEDEVPVGGCWRPRRTSMEHLQLHTRSVLDLTWKETRAVPLNLFHPDSLAQPTGIEWPAQAAAEPQPGTGD